MAILKGRIELYPHAGGTPVARGMLYLHITPPLPSGTIRAQGTLSQITWLSQAEQQMDIPAGTQFQAVFDDGKKLELILTRQIFTACGPEVLRFTAADPVAANSLLAATSH